MAELTEEDAIDKLRALRNPPKEESQNEEVQDAHENAQWQEQETEVLESAGETQQPAEAAESVTEPTKEAQSDAETVELDVEQLSQILGLEPDYLDVEDDGKIRIKTKVDGEEGKTTLQDLLKSYQIDAHLTKKGNEIQKLEEQRKRELSEFVSKTQSFAQQSASILESLKEAYVQPLSEADLKALRESDPAEYAARKEEQRDRELRFSNMANMALRQIEEAQKSQIEEAQRMYTTYLAEQDAILRKNVPSIDKEWANVVNYAKSIGYTDDMLKQAAAASFFTAMYKAMMYDKGTTGAKQKLQKPKPKLIKPSARTSKGQVQMEELAKKVAILKKSGKEEDMLALLKATRK